MRKKFVAGNWKMNTTWQTAEELAAAVVKGLGGDSQVTVALCPPFPYLLRVCEVIEGSPVALGAQNVYPEKEGAFTGEISTRMLQDVGCTYVIIGHSERRHILGEKDDFINRKVKAALEAGLQVILCVGETEAERDASKTESVLDTQVTNGLQGLSAENMQQLIIAYEPVWAIGTGKNATPDQAQEAHAFIRRRVSETFSKQIADQLIIQYGGSVKPDNAAVLMSQPDVDGALVGGASLKADQFLAIIQAASPAGG